MKFAFLMFLASGVINATPVQDDVVMAVVDGSDGVFHDREQRSFDSTKGPGVPWELDRIDQRKSRLDGKYNAFANGKTD